MQEQSEGKAIGSRCRRDAGESENGMNDTSPDVERRYLEMVMALFPERQLKMAAAMFTSARKLVEAAIRRDFDHPSRQEMRRGLVRGLYGQVLSPAFLEGVFSRM